MKERERQKESGLWIIHPCSNFRYKNDDYFKINIIEILNSKKIFFLIKGFIGIYACKLFFFF